MNQHKANTGDDHIFSQRPMIYGPHVVTLVLIQHSYTFSNCDFNNFRKKKLRFHGIIAKMFM